MKKKFISILMVITLAVALCACTGSDSEETSVSDASADASADELVEVTLGTTAWPTNMFYYLADEQGFFEENGISVTITDFSSTTEITNAFISGQLDFATFASSETIAPYSQGGEFYIVLETDKSNGCEGLVATSDITSIEDLEGKTIATQLYSVDHMLLLTLLAENDMSEDDITIVDMSIQEAGTAFIAGQCDAACIWDPYFTEAVESGGNILFSSADQPDLITDVLGASVEMCEEYPDVVTAILKSFFEAVDYWEENQDEANEYMGEKLGVSAEDFAAQMEGLIIPTEEEVLEAFTEADDYTYWGYTQNTVRDFLYELEILETNDFDCGEMIDSSFIKGLIE